jgi:hypothetical protein
VDDTEPPPVGTERPITDCRLVGAGRPRAPDPAVPVERPILTAGDPRRPLLHPAARPADTDTDADGNGDLSADADGTSSKVVSLLIHNGKS